MTALAVREGNTLTPAESVLLVEYETAIERGLCASSAGLLAIRDSRPKLYRSTHKTFEAYCHDRWGISRKRAYDLIAAEEVQAVLSQIGDIPLPRNESVARELAPLKDRPDELEAAWAIAVHIAGDKPPTAAQVREVVRAEPEDVEQPEPELVNDYSAEGEIIDATVIEDPASADDDASPCDARNEAETDDITPAPASSSLLAFRSQVLLEHSATDRASAADRIEAAAQILAKHGIRLVHSTTHEYTP